MDRSSNLNYERDEKGKIKEIRTGRSKQANEETEAKQPIKSRLGYSLATYKLSSYNTTPTTLHPPPTHSKARIIKRPSSSNDNKEHLKSSDQSTNRQIKQDNDKSSLYTDSRQTFQSSSEVSKITSTYHAVQRKSISLERKSLKPSRSLSTLNDERSFDPSSKSDNVETRQGTISKRRVSISRKQNSPVRQTITSTVDSTRRFSSNAASSSMTQQGAAVSKKHYSSNIHGAETTRRSSTSQKHPIRSPTKKRSFKNESHNWKAVNERHPLRSQAQSNDFYNEKDHGTKRKGEEEPMTRTSNLKKRRIQSRSLYEGKIVKFVSYQGHPYGFVTSEGISHEERQIYCIGTTDIHFSFRCVLSSLLELQTGDIISFKLQEPRTKRKDRVRAVNVTVLQLSKRSYRVLKDYLTRVEDALDSKEEGSDIRETFGYGDLFIDSDDARLGDSDVDEHANGNKNERETVHDSVESDMNQSSGSGDGRLTKNNIINIEKEQKLWHDECEEDDRLLVNSTPVSKQIKLDIDFINRETGDYRLSWQNVRLSSPDDEVFETNASGRGWKNERNFTRSMDIDPIDIHDTLPPHNAEVSNENSPEEKQLASQFEINRSPYHGIKRDRNSGSPQLKDWSIPRRSRREVSRKPEACKQFQTKDVLSSPTVWQHVIKQISSSHDNHQTLIQQYLRVVVKLCGKTQSLKELFRQVLMKIAEEATFLNPISGSLRRYIDQLMKDIERESKKGDTKDDSEDTLHPGRDFPDTEAELLNQDVEETLGECSSFQGGLDDVQESTNGYIPNSPKFVHSECERMLLERGSETEEEVANPSDEEGRPSSGDCKNEEVRESIDLEDGEIVDVDEKRKAKLKTIEINSSNQSEKRVNSLLASPIDGTSKIFNKHNDDLIDENKTVRKNNSRQRRGDNDFKSISTLRENLKLVRDFLLVISRTIPEKRATILSLVKILMRRSHLQQQNLEMSIFLYNLLKTFTVGSLDNIDELQWQDLPLILKKDEIFNELEEAINLRAVKKKGCYESADEYMDVYFRLLREDCFYNLKKSIKQLINGELDIRDMNVYEKVSLYGINVAKGSVQFALKIFSVKDVKDWSRSSHLKFGDLMCLSTDGTFKQPFWVTVTSKDHMQEKGVVLVQPCDEWNDFKGAEFIIHLMRSRGHIYMVESPNYYRSYQPVFKTLQSLNVNRLSFKEELVKLEKGRLPDFLHPSHTIDSRLVYRTPNTSEPLKAKATSNSTINHDSPESNKPIVAVNSLSSLPPNQTDSATNQINATTSSLAVTSNSVTSEIAMAQNWSSPTTQTSSFIMKLKKDIILPPTPPQLPPTQLPSPTQPPQTPTPPPRDCAFTMQRENEKHKITLEDFFDTPHSDVKSIFDPSQEEAVKTCLQNRIGIIQGPPGCGKTFIGVQMVRLLLSLSSLHKPKIFVLTYKNHALDEFLKGISK
uniref:DNA2/NAM7 helicase helicase domain-containing protein n=1 Tax=Clytia hemisphaerica TaxID=252671 RepID=A0A7M5V703_9CNID